MSKLTRKEFLGLTAGAAFTSMSNSATGQAAASANVPARHGKFLIRSADVLTMDPALGSIPAGDVRVEEGRIVEIGHGLAAGDSHVIHAKDMILMPGMVDGHRHVWEGIEAGHLIKTEPKLYSTYQYSKKKVMVCLTPEDHYLAGYIGGLKAIDSGVTTVVDYAHVQYSKERAIESARGLKESGIGGWFAYQLSHTPTYGPGDTISLAEANAEQGAMADDAHFQNFAALEKEVFSASTGSLRLGSAVSVGMFGKPLPQVKAEFERIRATGVQFIAIHIHKSQKPLPKGSFGATGSGVADLQQAGLLAPDLQLVHANDLSTEELAMMHDHGVMVASCPMGEFPYRAEGNRGSVHARARKARVGSGIGIDVGCALTQDYFEHVRDTFWNLYLDEESMALAEDFKSEDTIDFATHWGAKGVRLDSVTGSITVGKRADLVLLRTDRFGFAMMGTLADRVANFATIQDVDSVWVNGKLMKSNGKMIGVDWVSLKKRMRAVQERVSAQTETIKFT